MISVKPINKFKTFKYDAAPFFFYLEIFPPDLTGFDSERDVAILKKIINNPIMPLPMRVDRVFNGELSVLIRPREPLIFPVMDDLKAIINPTKFLQYGIEQLINFTEIRAFDRFALSLTTQKAEKWWNSTKFLYAKLLDLENDFSAFLNLYIDNLLKAKLNQEDLISAAEKYCKGIQTLCEKKIEENSIMIETTHLQTHVRLYVKKIAKLREKMKKVEQVQFHPDLINLDVYDLSEVGYVNNFERLNSSLDLLKPNLLKYIPLLFYDDLLECMLLNVKKLEEGEDNLLDPSFLIDQNVIIIQESKDLENIKIQDYSWFNTFDDINFEELIQAIKSTLDEYIKTKGESMKKDLYKSYLPPPSRSS
ncbi:MAG: hypothetical protein ACFE9S_01460 [Candidatus Hermodarchaeota archaeon]